MSAKIMGVATTSTTAGVTTVVKTSEAHRVLVWLWALPGGQRWSQQRGSGRSSGEGKCGRRNGAREREASDRSPVRLSASGTDGSDVAYSSRQEVSRAMVGGLSGPEAFTFLLRLLVTHFDGSVTGEGYTRLHTLECVTAHLF